MPSDEQLKSLFLAFAEKRDAAFLEVAEVIINEELAANHHALANELRKALELQRQPQRVQPIHRSLTSMPKDRRNGETLIALAESHVSQDQLVLDAASDKKIQRLLEEHRQRDRLAHYGYRPKNRLLFWGPPGCGKTFTAHYVAHELGLPIGTIRLNAVISSFLGDTASHIQRVFDLAGGSPMVLLLDEVDAIAKERDDPNDIGELKRVVNSLLQAMDSFTSSESIIIAASNHQYLLDPAVWRRFDEIVHFGKPGKAEREQYLRMLLNGVEFQGSLPNLAETLQGLSFADIQHVTVEAIKTRILQGETKVRSEDVTEQYSTLTKDLTMAIGGQTGECGMKLKWRDFPDASIAEIGDESTEGFKLKVSCCKFRFSTWWLERKGFGDTRLIVKGWLESEDIDARKAEAVDNVKHWLREMTQKWEGVEA